MHVEECCQALLARILPNVDRNRQGVCIDAGVGTFAFFCELFARLGFRTVAVEPLPVDALRETCDRNGIVLVEACVSDVDGYQSLYVGTFEGTENLNLCSLLPDWWGVSTENRHVLSMTLPTLLSNLDARTVTCLKLDVEGAELTVLRQLLSLPEPSLPSVVVFEYGGGDSKESGRAAWSPQFLAATMECLTVLKKCGYGLSIRIDSAPRTVERIFDLQTSSLAADHIFCTRAVYGNIISLRDSVHRESEIARTCAAHRDNEAPPPPLRLLDNPLKKLLRYAYGVIIR